MKSQNFTSINDTIQLNKGDGISLAAHQTAKVDAYTVQGALIDRNGGRGINLEAHDGAVINASSTIGGFDTVTAGMNLISGTLYAEQNVIRGNASDGVRFLAASGGTINGNLINNLIESNRGDGASLVVDNGGTLNFGIPGPNGKPTGHEKISHNMILSNDGVGLRLSSTVSADGIPALIDAVVQKNTISNNLGGGIASQMFGTGAPNFINLTVGGPLAPPNTAAEDDSRALAKHD